MDETERRLRSAMMAAAESAPPGLLAGIYRRHRRHRRQQAAAFLAIGAVLVFAVPAIGHELLAGPLSGARHTGVTVSHGLSPAVRATSGTMLLTCNDANWGQLESNWRAGSVRAGPLWFVAGRIDGYVHHGSYRPHR